MPKTLTGRLVSVTPETDGGNVVTAAPATTTGLTLDDVLDFDDSGWLVLNGGAPLAYTSVDEDAGTVTLAAAVGVAVEVDDRVDVFNPGAGAGGSIVVEYAAQVLLDDQDPEAKPIEAELSHNLVQLLGTKVRDLTGEWVTLEQPDEASDDYTVVGVSGKRPQSDGAYTYNPLVSGHLAANTAWPDDDWNVIPWTFEDQVDVPYDPATRKFTIVVAGKYLISVGGAFESNSNGRRGVAIWIENAGGLVLGRRIVIPAEQVTATEATRIIRLYAGDRVYLEAFQTSGAALDLLANPTTVDILRVAP